jgi:hypothetical protein
MRVTIFLGIALTIAFAAASLAEPGHNRGAGTSNSTITNLTGGVGTGALAARSNPFGREPGSPTFDPLAQTLSSSSTALLEVELQRLMRTWKLGRLS